MEQFCAHIVLFVFGWLSLTSAGCSCVPTSSSSSNRDSEEAAAKSASEQQADKAQAQKEARDSAATKQVADSKPTAKEQAAGAAKSRNSTGGSSSGGNRTKEEKKQSGLASIAEGLFRTKDEAKSALTAADAHRKATGLEKEAVELESKGRTSEAFEKALEAWQLVRVHDQDADCCGLAQRLEPILERLGEAASAGRYRTTGKPLKVE
jgi:hypothetical protein